MTSPSSASSSYNPALMPSYITVTVSDISRALDEMGSAEQVSATRLYQTIFEMKTAPSRAARATSHNKGEVSSEIRSDSEAEVLTPTERKRRMLETARALYPNGVPPLR
ncbi:hypothetical protein M413DRAFT_449569, partial [Hebeloma cylindrosporum]